MLKEDGYKNFQLRQISNQYIYTKKTAFILLENHY